jgi:transcriptional regulator with XRE-family HTH domain
MRSAAFAMEPKCFFTSLKSISGLSIVVDDMSTPADVVFVTLSCVAKDPIKTTFLERLNGALTAMTVDTKSPTEVGKFLGVNKQTAARWLAGGEPSIGMLFKIADKLKVNPRYLAEGTLPIEPEPRLDPREYEAVTQIFRVLAKHNKKALDEWLRSGRKLVELTTPTGAENPYGA